MDWFTNSFSSRYIDMALNPDSGIRKQDGRSVVNAVASSSAGNAIAWTWIQDNWAVIRTYFDTSVSSPIARMFESVTRGFNTAKDLAELEAFAQVNSDNLGTAQRATESAVVTTKANLEWMQNYFDDIVDWLSKREGSVAAK